MNVKVFCVKDDFLGFQDPFIDLHEGSATRRFEMMVNKKDSIFNIHPEHFNLYQIANFDTESGMYDNEQKFIVAGTSMIKE